MLAMLMTMRTMATAVAVAMAMYGDDEELVTKTMIMERRQ